MNSSKYPSDIKKITSSLFASWFLFVLSLSMRVGAAEYYVSTTGNDAAAGTVGAPWASFSKAVSVVVAGDTVTIRGGSYGEKLLFNGLTGTALSPIIFRNFTGETVEINGGSLTVPAGSGRDGLVVIQNSNYVTLKGIKVKNYKTSNRSAVPVGIQIEGACEGVTVSGCTVTEIWQNSTNQNANGFGISIYGTSLTAPINGLILEGNTVHNLRTGQSESVALNGNVTNFKVIKNHVYDCNNIGIDFIGYEDTVSDPY